MIAWKYLNKPSATVAALQDYWTMREIIKIINKTFSRILFKQYMILI